MSTRDEQGVPGYPGFAVVAPAPVTAASGVLRGIARAKLLGVTAISSWFRDEVFLFHPWLTALVEYRHEMIMTGVYRTDEAAGAAHEPSWCLRKSVWQRERDQRHVSDRDDPEAARAYVADGPQIDNTFVFANAHTHPAATSVMAAALGVLTEGVTVEPANTRDVPWEAVVADLADDRLAVALEYSPLTATCHALETALPPWLEAVDHLLETPGIAPERHVRVSVTRSVQERL